MLTDGNGRDLRLRLADRERALQRRGPHTGQPMPRVEPWRLQAGSEGGTVQLPAARFADVRGRMQRQAQADARARALRRVGARDVADPI